MKLKKLQDILCEVGININLLETASKYPSLEIDLGQIEASKAILMKTWDTTWQEYWNMILERNEKS